jgi:hypothetical protein
VRSVANLCHSFTFISDDAAGDAIPADDAAHDAADYAADDAVADDADHVSGDCGIPMVLNMPLELCWVFQGRKVLVG